MRQITLRYQGKCSDCGAPLKPGQTAWWEETQREISCLGCRGREHAVEPSHESVEFTPEDTHAGLESDSPFANSALFGPADGVAIDRGTPGASALQRYQKLHDARKRRLEENWGPFAGVVEFLTDEPQSTKAWLHGAIGEQRLAQVMETIPRAITLYDRRVPDSQANIDAIVIHASGIWVVDAKRYTGLVSFRDRGGVFRRDLRIYVGKRDCTAICDAVIRQVSLVANAVRCYDANVPVQGVACLITSEWPLLLGPRMIRGVLVTPPKTFARKLRGQSRANCNDVNEAADYLARAFPAK